MNSPSRFQVVLAFLAIYLIWGSTYLAIRFAIETLPPFLMAGMRFIIAGAVLYIWMRARGGAQPPARIHWRNTAIVGGLLLLGGNGGVVWAEQIVPSSLAAVLIATSPLWMVLLGWAWRGSAPGRRVVAGLLLGFAGVVLLVGPGALSGNGQVDPLGAVVLIGAALAWAIGSHFAQRSALPASSLLATAMEMLAGGALLFLAGLVGGEAARVDPSGFSLRSVLAFLYLIVFGSLVGYSAYTWLLRVTTLARASTYAYVNPVVAVLLGWALGGEQLTPQTLLATAVTLSGVVLIITQQAQSRAAVPRGADGEGARKQDATLIEPSRVAK
jgi:drug/metabolite transporter (DMT)-like permease